MSMKYIFIIGILFCVGCDESYTFEARNIETCGKSCSNELTVMESYSPKDGCKCMMRNKHVVPVGSGNENK
jgi:hypothetical protein